MVTPPTTWTVTVGPDGSEVVRIEARVLVDRANHLETRSADSSIQHIGYITGEIPQ